MEILCTCTCYGSSTHNIIMQEQHAGDTKLSCDSGVSHYFCAFLVVLISVLVIIMGVLFCCVCALCEI